MDGLDQIQVTFFRGSGPGGQHRNKVETGVRILHIPTGTLVSCCETRSQSRNREIALSKLQTQLKRAQEALNPTPRIPTAKSRAQRNSELLFKSRRSYIKRLRRNPVLD